jgi:hypothetical protein
MRKPPGPKDRTETVGDVDYSMADRFLWRLGEIVSLGVSAPTGTAPACPSCDEPEPLRIVYGMASPAMGEAAARGDYALGGCVVELTSPDWRCRSCGHEWADGTTRARVTESLRSRRRG